MAYLLKFPASTLPDNIYAPPFVIFGINGSSVVDKLPSRIPLNAVLHFIPKLAQYVLPAPESLPPKVAQGVLHTPYVGIDICLDIGIASLQRIILKVLQSAGRAIPKEQLQRPPSIITSISIRKTWLLFELPPAGVDGLLIHLQTLLMTGPAVTITEMKELWNAFPSDSDMLRVTAINFVQAHICLHYTREEYAEIRSWYMSTKERRKVFRAAEAMYPEFGKTRLIRSDSQVRVNGFAAESRKTIGKEDLAALRAEILEEVKKEMKEEIEALERKKEKKDIEALEKKEVKKNSRGASMDEGKTNSTIRKSTKWRSSEMLAFKAGSMEDVSNKLSDALRKLELKQESESAPSEGAEMLQPTAYDPSKPST
jgi:hypothetical protein